LTEFKVKEISRL